ncbi:hypothetical protein [Saccharibacillus sacchari]|nr:hypothetical protein [Saccharibacillus sacchari]
MENKSISEAGRRLFSEFHMTLSSIRQYVAWWSKANKRRSCGSI